MKNYTDSEFFDSPFRGVTSVLNAIFGNKFENAGIPEHILKAAGERGTAVHKYIEDWLNWFSEDGDEKNEPHLNTTQTFNLCSHQRFKRRRSSRYVFRPQQNIH